MKFNLIETKELLDLEDELSLTLVVNERNPHFNLPRFYVKFEGAEVMENGCLIGEHGNGYSIDEALHNYAKSIQCKQIAINAYSDHRKEIMLPRLKHTKLLGR